MMFAALIALPLFAGAAEPAGTVVIVTGKATALGEDGLVRKLAKNDPVYSGDIVNSGAGSYVNLRFADGAYFLLRPDTRFQIEQYAYAPAAAPAVSPIPKSSAAAAPLVTAAPVAVASASSRAFFRLVKGGFRSASGLIGKLNQDAYRVSTPVATIGIRGTRYSARLCDGSCEDQAQLSAQMGTDSSAPVLVTTVDEGAIEMENPAGKLPQPACKMVTDAAGKTQEINCGAILTTTGGKTVVLPQRPTIEMNERSVDPASCT